MARSSDNQLKKLTAAVKEHKVALKMAEKELKLYKKEQAKAAKSAKKVAPKRVKSKEGRTVSGSKKAA